MLQNDSKIWILAGILFSLNITQRYNVFEIDDLMNIRGIS